MAYDRNSVNTNCGLYVLFDCKKEESGSWSPINAVIQDYYAYEYKSGKCIRKDNQDQSTSEEYVELTGEH